MHPQLFEIRSSIAKIAFENVPENVPEHNDRRRHISRHTFGHAFGVQIPNPGSVPRRAKHEIFDVLPPPLRGLIGALLKHDPRICVNGVGAIFGRDSGQQGPRLGVCLYVRSTSQTSRTDPNLGPKTSKEQKSKPNEAHAAYGSGFLLTA
jgi:hypothetical protein